MDQKADVTEKTEAIREEMEGTRASLGKKIEALENTVVGSVKEVAATATETVSEVTEAVQGTVETVTEAVSGAATAVQSALDIPAHVRRHPWISLGGAFVVGVMSARLLHPSRSTGRQSGGDRDSGDRDDWRYQRRQEEQYQTPSARSEESGDGWLHSLGGGFEEMIQDVKNLAVSTTLSFARDLLSGSVSEGLKPHIAGILDRFTSHLGAQPIEGPVVSSEDDQRDDDDDEGGNGHPESTQAPRRPHTGNHHKQRGKKRGSNK
jgi:ElaB/YqjD/DUF883 family membrane-anchored ribosome-binding protein